MRERARSPSPFKLSQMTPLDLQAQKEIRATSSAQFLVILIAVGASSLCSYKAGHANEQDSLTSVCGSVVVQLLLTFIC